MDIVEVGGMGVRSAVVEMRAKGSRCRFTLYPMVHLADTKFYAEIAERLAGHDLIVAEGVGASRSARLLTFTYRLARLNRKLGLHVQSRGLYDVGVPVVNPDMTGDEFDRGWQQVNVLERMTAWVLCPVYALFMWLFATRGFLAHRLAIDDDILHLEDPSSLDIEKLIQDDRDALLCAALTEIHEQRRHEPISVAVVWGARHVRPVVTYLRARHGYVIRDCDWMTLFTV